MIYDDHFPTWEEIVSISNVYSVPKNILGDQRYYPKQWPPKQHRVMIVLTNHPPDYKSQQAGVAARFRFITLGSEQKLYDPTVDPPVYGEDEHGEEQ